MNQLERITITLITNRNVDRNWSIQIKANTTTTTTTYIIYKLARIN